MSTERGARSGERKDGGRNAAAPTLAQIALQYFTPYQVAWIRDESPMKLVEKSRRIGWTYATSFRRVYKAMTVPGLTCWVSTRDLSTAKEFVRDCAKWCNLANVVASGLAGDRTEVISAEKDITAQVIEFANGSRIYVLTSNPDALAGKGGDVVLDEFALHKDAERLWQVALPTASVWGFQLEVISTHRGKNTVFNGFCKDAKGPNKMGWSFYSIDIVKAANEGLVERINKAAAERGRPPMSIEEFLRVQRSRCNTEADWNQEYMCQPVDDYGSLLSYSLIAQCSAPGKELLEVKPAGPCYLGMDIGRRKDLSVIWVLEEVGGVLNTRHIERMEAIPFRGQLNVLIDICERFEIRAGRIDGTGIGMQLAEDAATDIGSHVLGVDFTHPAKERMATALLRRFQDSGVKVTDDEQTREGLHKVEKAVSDKGVIRYVAPRDEDGHADEFWALALAVEAAESGDGFVEAMRIREDRGTGDGGRETGMRISVADQNAMDEANELAQAGGRESW
jgi:phage FluMu gp28-like protein